MGGGEKTGAVIEIIPDDPDGVAVVVASDHHIPDVEGFHAAIGQALATARQGRIVSLGIRPSEPSTAYGYIQLGAALPAGGHAVAAFVEKPDAPTARAYVDQGYLWNSGNLIARAAVLIDELAHHAPEVMTAAQRAIAGPADAAVVRLGEAFRAAPKISIDYALMEKTRRAAVVPARWQLSAPALP